MDHTSAESFWSLLDQLLTHGGFNKPLVESILGTPLRRVHRNKFYDFHEGDGTVVRGLTIRKVELRLKRNANAVGTLIIDFGEPCVTLAEIKKRHPALTPTPLSSDSADELIHYTAKYPFRHLSFGFPQENSAYATQVVVEARGEAETQ